MKKRRFYYQLYTDEEHAYEWFPLFLDQYLITICIFQSVLTRQDLREETDWGRCTVFTQTKTVSPPLPGS